MSPQKPAGSCPGASSLRRVSASKDFAPRRQRPCWPTAGLHASMKRYAETHASPGRCNGLMLVCNGLMPVCNGLMPVPAAGLHLRRSVLPCHGDGSERMPRRWWACHSSVFDLVRCSWSGAMLSTLMLPPRGDKRPRWCRRGVPREACPRRGPWSQQPLPGPVLIVCRAGLWWESAHT